MLASPNGYISLIALFRYEGVIMSWPMPHRDLYYTRSWDWIVEYGEWYNDGIILVRVIPMSLVVTLPNELEQFLQNYARRVGVPVETLLTRTIVERWDGVRRAPGLPNRESELLLRLQTLFSPEQIREYRDLCAKSDAETLTEIERERFLALLEQRDHQNADRLDIVAELAQLRGVSLRDMMAALGIRPE
jgi:hypothetical protein